MRMAEYVVFIIVINGKIYSDYFNRNKQYYYRQEYIDELELFLNYFKPTGQNSKYCHAENDLTRLEFKPERFFDSNNISGYITPNVHRNPLDYVTQYYVEIIDIVPNYKIWPATQACDEYTTSCLDGTCYDSDGWIRLIRGSTAICIGDASSNHRGISTGKFNIPSSNIALLNYTNTYLDSPITTSETTYKLQFATNGAAFYFNRTWSDADSSAGPRVASTITAMEIGV